MPDKNGNQNCLDGYECPQCGEHEKLLIHVDTRIEMFDMGSGDHEDLNYDNTTHADCPSCYYGGKLETFLIPGYEPA